AQRLFRQSRRDNADIRPAWSDLRRAARGGKSLTPVKWIPQKHLFDLLLVHGVEIVRHGELPRHEIEALRRGGGVDRHDLDQRLARLGDDERLPLRGGVDEPGEVGLGLVDVDGAHWPYPGLVERT